MERVPWITASIKGLTVTGLKTGLGADKRAADGRREYSRKRASPRLDSLGGGGRGDVGGVAGVAGVEG